MNKIKEEKYKRTFWPYLLVAAVLIASVSVFTEGVTRPLRYYTDDNGTALTYYTQLGGQTNVSAWGINTDNPVCELQVGPAICINGSNTSSQGVFINGTALGSGSGGAPTTATYVTLSNDATLTAERVLTPGAGILLADTGANGVVRVNVSATTCTTGNYSYWNGTGFFCSADSGAAAGTNGTVTSLTEGLGINLTPDTITTTGSIGIANLATCNSVTEYSVWNGSHWLCDNDGTGGTMSEWIISNGSSTETITNSETVNIVNGTGIRVSQSTNTLTIFNTITDTDTDTNTNVSTFNSTRSGTTTTLQINLTDGKSFNTSFAYTDTDTNTNISTFNSTKSGSTVTLQINLTDGKSFNTSFADTDTNTDTNTNVSTVNFTVSGTITTLQINLTDGKSFNSSFNDQTGSGGNSTIQIQAAINNSGGLAAYNISISCANITGGSDGDFCNDATGGGGSGGNISSSNGTEGFLALFSNSTNLVSNYTPSFFYFASNPSGYISSYLQHNISAFNYTVSTRILQLNTTRGDSWNVTLSADTDTDTNTNISTFNSTKSGSTVTLQINLTDGKSFNTSFADTDTNTDTNTNVSTVNFTVSGTSVTLQINLTDGKSFNTSFTDQTGGGGSGGNLTSTANGTAQYLPKYTNATNVQNSEIRMNSTHWYWNGLLFASVNSTCHTLYSPDGSVAFDACD